MKQLVTIAWVIVCSAMIQSNTYASKLSTDIQFVTIGSGDVSGVYFPTGLALADMINRKRPTHGIRATVQSTRGSVFNVNALMAGYLEFGLVQSDKQYQAVKGLAEWTDKGPQRNLRAVFSLHPESANLLASVDANIRTIADLKGKRVNLGNLGSGQYQNAIDALRAVGLDPQRDIIAQHVRTTEALGLLRNDRLDAFFCTLGHPSELLEDVTTGPREVRFVPITGPGIDRLIVKHPYYAKTAIPVTGLYQDAKNLVDVETFGVKATLCTSAEMPDPVVYMIVKEVFDHFDQFKRLHPSYADLTKAGMLEGLSAPLHPGAVKYFKEVGMKSRDLR